MKLFLFIYILIINFYPSFEYDTGFWYKGDRLPDLTYDTIPYANLTVRVDRSYFEGPGQNLVSDPNKGLDSVIYTGVTINRQTFDTQFILDMEYALGLDRDRIFVLFVSPGSVHFSWEVNNVIVNFIFLERNHSQGNITLLEAVATLTNQIQNPKSRLYTGTNVTKDIDPLWGLEVVNWDMSLKLGYAIEVIGGANVIDKYYLNQGGLGTCDGPQSINNSLYCEFERFFEDDVSRALNISYYRVNILFIKKAAYDSVIIYFRIVPPRRDAIENNVTLALADLIVQVHDLESELYKGNVTIRVDPIWGVSETFPTARTKEALYTIKWYEYDDSRLLDPGRKKRMTGYDRCKANRRCNWGVVDLDQNSNIPSYYQRLFDMGTLFKVDLFLNFEDWRMGTRGFNYEGNLPSTLLNGRIRGAHFSPFNATSLGPDIPCYELERNQGLVLDRQLQASQIDWQEILISDLKGRVDWLFKNIEWATMGPIYRSRKDVKEYLTRVKHNYTEWHDNEVSELIQLNTSQCSLTNCTIMFNTSSLQLTGAIQGIGNLIKTENGTEVAVFSFNSIYLGPETEVILCGQRAISLVSRTSTVINTTIQVIPGTIGGFPGGYSIARELDEALDDKPRDIIICELGGYCDEDIYNVSSISSSQIFTNNVNGPGSGNLRVHPFVIISSAATVREIQVITTTAQKGQTLSGGFTLNFGEYTSPVIPHNVSAAALKYIIENNLNMNNPADRNTLPIRDHLLSRKAGVGIVNVTRSFQNDQEGYTWNITFTTAIGNIPQLKITTYLKSLESDIQIYTHQDGNEILGSFRLSFMGQTTEAISAYESSKSLQAKLLKLPMIKTAYVDRNDPTENCDDGLCHNGPLDSRGMIWTIYFTTDEIEDNITPTSPTSPTAKLQGKIFDLVAHTAGLKGIDSKISIYRGMSQSNEDMKRILNVSIPFSLAYGGGGGSYGGGGGAGYSSNPVGRVYNDEFLTDLLGGSGGAMRSQHPFEINSFMGKTTGRGGHGGGAIEIVASNDLVIGSFGKIVVVGGDGEQTSQGGGGGGSGGSILLAAGGTISHQGVLDASGGDGGYGGPGKRRYHSESSMEEINSNPLEYKVLDGMAGGGGGGGRIALYAESIVMADNALLRNEGGKCGILKTIKNESVVFFTVSLHVLLDVPLNDERIIYLGATYINRTISTLFVDFNAKSQSQQGSNITIHELKYLVTVASDTTYSFLTKSFNATIGMLLAQVVISRYDITGFALGYKSFIVESPSKCENHGKAGSVYKSSTMTSAFVVKPTRGAEQTSYALFLSNNEVTKTLSGSIREAPFAKNGPIISFNKSKPGRITYYTKLDSVRGESQKSSFGTLFTITSRTNRTDEPIIGIYFGDKIMHGANFEVTVDENFFLKRMVTIDEYPTFDVWYKVDIHLDWEKMTYLVLLNDILVTSENRFEASHLDGIRLSVNRAANVWFDEIYVGFDNTMGFLCPQVGRREVKKGTPIQKGWSLNEDGGVYETIDGKLIDGNYLYRMQRHYNYLDPTGSIPFDGQGQISLLQDIKYKFPSGDYNSAPGKLHAGAMFYVTNSLRSSKSASGRSATLVSPDGLWYQAKEGIGGTGDGRQFMYTEYDYNYQDPAFSSLNGGIAACSSNDMIKWRYEGIVFHYVNLTDQVYGSTGPFAMDRPRVLFNPSTNMYVMWAAMDNLNRTFAMNAVATSPFEDGPFLFRRSFYPDGNKTRDQVIYKAGGGQTVLGRTYYATIEYVLPEAIMQPSWESAKDRSGVTDFRLSYQRAKYDIGYDNYHDIYEQRWRKEDLVYRVFCEDKVTGVRRPVESGVVTSEGAVCIDPNEIKIIEGQGNPPIFTKFVDPLNVNNSWWMQTSVPSVKSQPWYSSYKDGYCGVRKVDENLDEDDPNLAKFKAEYRGTCSNIADNPIHPALQDKLIGVQKVAFRRRSKFIALSSLTGDYLDTSGFLNVYEGEFDTGNLVSMISEMGQFGFKVDTNTDDEIKFKSTYPAPVRSEYETAVDFSYRFRQYMQNYNDRATYALACAIDGICPVDFKTQVLKN